ncbi:MAG TPA: PHP domain-containing protein, partial [Methanocorpusculum sp.]|nr:PHP domain-containing protein [Methanocorpusculum sp.]
QLIRFNTNKLTENPMPELRCDLHIHTSASPDGHCPVESVIKTAAERGLDAVAITDHDTTASASKAAGLTDAPVLIIPGIEVSTADGHILVLGTTKEYAKGKPAEETIREAKADGCLVIMPHPFHKFRHAVGLANPDCMPLVDAIEAYNSRYYTKTSNERAASMARSLNKPITAGSDAHDCEFVGYGINIINAEEKSVNGILTAIRAGAIRAECIQTPPSVYTKESYHNVMRKVKKFLHLGQQK